MVVCVLSGVMYNYIPEAKNWFAVSNNKLYKNEKIKGADLQYSQLNVNTYTSFSVNNSQKNEVLNNTIIFNPFPASRT